MRRSSRWLSSLALVTAAAAVACVQAAAAPVAPDPLQTDGDKYQLLLDNSFVRVLRYHDEPGATTHLHRHPCFVMYALGPFRRELTFPDGRRLSRELRSGEAAWMPAQAHTGHNVGDVPTDALLIELKGPCR
jgi:beta-alanine degradation protein BauB